MPTSRRRFLINGGSSILIPTAGYSAILSALIQPVWAQDNTGSNSTSQPANQNTDPTCFDTQSCNSDNNVSNTSAQTGNQNTDNSGSGGQQVEVVNFGDAEGAANGSVITSNLTAQTAQGQQSVGTVSDVLGVEMIAIGLIGTGIGFVPGFAILGGALAVAAGLGGGLAIGINHFGGDPARQDFTTQSIYNRRPPTGVPTGVILPPPGMAAVAQLTAWIQASFEPYVEAIYAIAALTVSNERYQGALAAYKGKWNFLGSPSGPNVSLADLKAAAIAGQLVVTQINAMKMNAAAASRACIAAAENATMISGWLKSSKIQDDLAGQTTRVTTVTAAQLSQLWQAQSASFAKTYQVGKQFIQSITIALQTIIARAPGPQAIDATWPAKLGQAINTNHDNLLIVGNALGKISEAAQSALAALSPTNFCVGKPGGNCAAQGAGGGGEGGGGDHGPGTPDKENK